MYHYLHYDTMVYWYTVIHLHTQYYNEILNSLEHCRIGTFKFVKYIIILYNATHAHRVRYTNCYTNTTVKLHFRTRYTYCTAILLFN